MTTFFLWEGVDDWRAEATEADLGPDGGRATGVQLGAEPVPYRLDYALELGPRWVTRRLEVTARGDGWSRHLDLRHDGEGVRTAAAEASGDVHLPPPGGDVAAIAGALDCDLAFSPLTNVMPVRRHDLHRTVGAVDFLMAWVSVPDLGVRPSRQRYEHVEPGTDVTFVDYVGSHRSFVGRLQLDRDGFVLSYPELARRVGFTPLTAQAGAADA